MAAELFTEAERAYLSSMRLGRLATVDPEGRPHVVPVGYRLTEEGTFEIRGPRMADSRKWKNIENDDKVAFVVDDMTPPDEAVYRPGVGRGVEILGRAELSADGPAGELAGPETITVVPEKVLSWHIDPSRRAISVLSDRGGRL